MHTSSEKNTRPVMVNLPIQMIESLDGVAAVMGTTRTAIIVRCLSRDLEHVLNFEIERFQALRRSLDALYGTKVAARSSEDIVP